MRRLILLSAAAIASCFPAYGIVSRQDGGETEGGADGGGVDGAGTPDASAESGQTDAADGGTSATDASDARTVETDAGDAGALPVVPNCGDMSGLEANAPWPMHGYCPAQRRRAPLPGPGAGITPTVHWHQAALVDSTFSPLVTATGLVVTVSTPSSTQTPGTSAMTAYDTSGAFKWTWTPPTGDAIEWAPAVGADDVIYVPCQNTVYGVGLDGNMRWTSPDAIGTRSPLIVGPGPTLYVDDSSSALWSLNGVGSKNWTATLPSTVDYMTPMFGVAGAGLTLFQTATNGSLSTVTTSGSVSPLWDGGGVATVMRAIAAPDGNIRISNESDDELWSVTPSGAVAWVWPAADAGDPGQPRIPAVGDDSVTYVGHAGGDVVAIDASGQQKWTTSPAMPLCNAITLGSDGIVYTGCDDGLHAYDPNGGTLLWHMAPNPSTAGLDYGISIGRGNMLYVNASDGTLYAVGP